MNRFLHNKAVLSRLNKNYFKGPNQVLGLGLSSAAGWLFVFLASISDEYDPPQDVIGEKLKMNRKTIGRAMAQLERAGVIKIHRGRTSGNKKRNHWEFQELSCWKPITRVKKGQDSARPKTTPKPGHKTDVSQGQNRPVLKEEKGAGPLQAPPTKQSGVGLDKSRNSSLSESMPPQRAAEGRGGPSTVSGGMSEIARLRALSGYQPHASKEPMSPHGPEKPLTLKWLESSHGPPMDRAIQADRMAMMKLMASVGRDPDEAGMELQEREWLSKQRDEALKINPC